MSHSEPPAQDTSSGEEDYIEHDDLSIRQQHQLQATDNRPQNDQPQVPTTKRPVPMQVTVQRAEIPSTSVQEGDEDEFEDLNVEVYDQQTYERGVFEQVNKAISAADQAASRTSNQNSVPTGSSKIDDIMRIIHAQNDQDLDEEACDPKERDEQVLQLTRLQRINKAIKVEREEPIANETVIKLPKIPKLSKATIKIESSDEHAQLTANISSISDRSRPIKREPFFQEEFDDTSSEDSRRSEYKPVSEEATDDELDEELEYDTDSVVEEDQDDIEAGRSISSKKRRLADDGDLKCYSARIKAYSKAKAKLRLDNILEDGTEFKKLDEIVEVEGSLQIPKEMWDNLFEHQKTGVRWLWELHQLGTGGILGDEMGLGKTIQMIAFLTSLKISNVVNAHKGYKNLGPSVLVCPATVMHQWLLEFRKWWPPFRVAILHNTGTFNGDRKNLVRVINKSGGILIVSFPGVVIYQDELHAFDWHYVILDEGHKIRNPDAQVTLACKRFRTPHRLILSGSPVQNNLKELWSIFDFIYPGKLGTLPVFMEQFATPITQGGYANASDIQVQIAYKCACVLRDTIKPFLLRRTKAEVSSILKLPDRSEQVLFCKLTDKQRKLYQDYLDSPTVRDIKSGYCLIFVGLTQLRKICNHPDLFDATECKKQIRETNQTEQQVVKKKHVEFFSEDESFGYHKKSGKMLVVDALLKLWKKQNHKVLLFTQSRQMLKIFVRYLGERNYKYLIMDGGTPIKVRQTMIEEFNTNGEIFIFLLTTRVGGVGVNLTGANRIIIYDPDWNPSTDIQARERAWRIGQNRQVIIYRLLTAGTIEEKIYHRQVFKLYLTNRILRDAKQKRFFKNNDLHELFRLGDDDKNIETKALFEDDLQITPESVKKSKRRKKRKQIESKNKQLKSYEHDQMFSDEKVRAMRERAKLLSRMISLQYGSKTTAQQEDCQVKVKMEPGLFEEVETPVPSPSQSKPGTSSLTSEANSFQQNRPEISDHHSGDNSKEKKVKRTHSKQRVKYLVKQDVYKPNEADPTSKQDRRQNSDYILERLFKSSNIFGALNHDKIETDSTADFKVVESEAEKVARDAIRALRESRRLCVDSSFGVPTWTGRNGQVASQRQLVPKNKGRLQLLNTTQTKSVSSNSDSLLSSIKKRNQLNPVALAKSTFNVAIDDDDDERVKDFEGKAKGCDAEDMADKIRDFVLFRSARNGESQTDEILEFFRENFRADKTSIFKAILYKMCEFQRRGNKGFWVLKSEFKDI